MPEAAGDKTPGRQFGSCPIGYVHIDIAKVQTAEGKLRPFVAIGRASWFVFIEPHEQGGTMVAAHKAWRNEPNWFTSNPHRQMPGSNSQSIILRR